MFSRNFCQKVIFGARRTTVFAADATLNPVRTLLSALYIKKEDAEFFTKSSVQSEEIALQTLSIDRCHERDLPVSSLLIDRLIRAIKDKEHLKGTLYYLFKFRHSQNNYHLQPWTVFAFVSKCLELDSSILMEALSNKVQYGVFPSSFMMNLVLDHFLKHDDIDGALKSTSEMFLMETLDNKISQILALHAISKYWQLNCHDDNKIPEFKDATMKRNLSAALFCIGRYLSNPSLVIIGNSLLGSIELEHGIRAIYQDPWGPMSSEPGYLIRAVECLESTKSPVSQQCLDILLECASKNEEVLAKAQSAIAIVKAKNKELVKNCVEYALEGIMSSIEPNLPQYEEKEQNVIRDLMKTWKSDSELLEELEKEILKEFEIARQKRFRELAIEEKSHQMAVETLGFWDLEKGRQNEETEADNVVEKPLYYLREEYVKGAMDDLELLERFRKRRSIVLDPVILV